MPDTLKRVNEIQKQRLHLIKKQNHSMQHKSNLTSGDVNKTTACNRGVRGNQKSNGDVTKCKFVKKVRGIISSSSSSSSVFEFKKYLYRILYSIQFLVNLVHFVNLWSRSISAVWWWCSSKVSHVGHSSHSTSRHSTHLAYLPFQAFLLHLLVLL